MIQFMFGNKPVKLLTYILANAGLSILILFLFMTGALKDWHTFLIGFLWAFSI